MPGGNASPISRVLLFNAIRIILNLAGCTAGVVLNPATRRAKMIVMERARCNLRVFLNRLTSRLPLRTLRRIWTHILNALVYLHANGIVHRDMKLENVLVFYDEGDDMNLEAFVLKICDVGLARITAAVASVTHRMTQGAGTPYYMVSVCMIYMCMFVCIYVCMYVCMCDSCDSFTYGRNVSASLLGPVLWDWANGTPRCCHQRRAL